MEIKTKQGSLERRLNEKKKKSAKENKQIL